jgi:hypothetical protein
MNSIDDFEKRIVKIKNDMLPLQKIYGLKSKTIEERYQEIQNRKQVLENKAKPRFKLPKL